MAIRTFVMADHRLTRECLCAVLQGYDGIEVVGDANGQDATPRVADLRPDIVLLRSAALHDKDVATVRSVKDRWPGTRVLVVTAEADQERLWQVLAAGASGYELLDITSSHLANAIRAVHRGETAINHVLLKQMAETLARNGRAPSGGASGLRALTRREHEVLVQVTKGLNDKDIAARLLLSEATVKSHLRAIYAKLHVHNRAQAATLAVQRGLDAPP